MNNSLIASEAVSLSLEEAVDITESLREEESRLIRIIEVIGALQKSAEWSTLKTLVFDGRIDSLEKQLVSESLKVSLNEAEIYRLQGRLFEARKYNIDSLLETYRTELSHIRKLTTQPTER